MKTLEFKTLASQVHQCTEYFSIVFTVYFNIMILFNLPAAEVGKLINGNSQASTIFKNEWPCVVHFFFPKKHFTESFTRVKYEGDVFVFQKSQCTRSRVEAVIIFI